jgi:salicylate hydroxylase
MEEHRIVVLGAGIGGLTTALALTRLGYAPVVYERSPVLPGTGGGIQIPPNGARVLHRLGLAPALAAAVRPEAIELRRWQDDSVLGRAELGAAALARYSAPHYTLGRATLCRALLEEVREAVRFGWRCDAITEDDDGAELRFAGGEVVRAGLVIGADGARSLVARELGAAGPSASGYVVHRALLPATLVPGPPVIQVWLGAGRHCVSYPVDSGLINVVVVAPAREDPGYAGWHPRVRELLVASDGEDRHGLYSSPQPRIRHRGRLVLTGDAAHPMLPFVAQGAAQAIEDAELLARCLGEPGGLARYDAERRARVGPIAAAAEAGGHTYHLNDGPEQERRDAGLRRWGLADLDWLYGAAVTA